MILVIFLAALLPAAMQQDSKEVQTFPENCSGNSCNPHLGDLMVGRAAQLSASSTCGLDGPQPYCIIGYLEGEQKCFTCDSRLPYNRYSNPNSHLIENIITTFDPERKMKWWQSENGVHQVSIQLNLETVFQFSHLILTFKSFRPAAMLVERSKDFGRTWKVFRYFAEDCGVYFPSVPHEPADSIDDVVCDSRYSGSEPSTGGEMVLKALDPVFEIDNPYAPNIQDLITMTNIRLNFTRLFTLGDTLLARRRRDPQNKYYYSVYNMVVQGSCFCNGHASRCGPVDGGRGDVFDQPGMIHGRCICEHNTAGENCERCQDFHHDSPWRPGRENTADICRRCNCHGHSDFCHFDLARFKATGGVSGGVCDNCLNNRMGPQCEQCGPFFYQDPQKSLDDPYACIPCDCDPAGSHGGGLCDARSGQCQCKDNVEGQRCDRCKNGFFALRRDDPAGCQECKCHRLGSIGSCDQQTGSCECRPFATGSLCDRCEAGFWGLGRSLRGCSPCDCDIGGALSNMCSSEDGQCPCLSNMIGRRCSDPAPGYFLPFLNYFLYEAERASPLSGRRSPTPPSPLVPPSPAPSPTASPLLKLPPCEQYFRQQGYDFKISNGQVVVVRKTRRLARRKRQEQLQQNIIPLDPAHALQIVPHQRSGDEPPTSTGLGFIRLLEGAGLRFTVDNIPSSMDYQMVIHYKLEALSDWLATVSVTMVSPGDGACSSNPTASQSQFLSGNSRLSFLDMVFCLNAGGKYLVDIIFNKQSESDSSYILVDSMGLIPRIESVQNFCSQNDLDSFRQFDCVGLAVERVSRESLPEICERLIKSLSARMHNGAIPCRCNVVGSVGTDCRKLGGFCDCKPNVIGRCCDTCAPLTFGFGPEGCERCECVPRGSVSEFCDQVRGQCACRSEVTGRRCDRCRTGFWGFPFCRQCECNGLSEVCDGETGECLNCREHATGPSCDRCADGYYGDPLSRQPCKPCLCPDVLGSGLFFATSCQQDSESLSLSCNCREGHTGPRCDRCGLGFYGDLTKPGARCEACPCNNNIDLDYQDACNSVTGECLRCLHNTAGPNCQDCKAGYYGNALQQACKECSCDRRGTEVSLCPLQSPCFCDQRTGQCPCRKGVVGELCNVCEDGFWNLDGISGCQPCSCDPLNSISNICDKVTGQCPCRSEFGGRQCDECAENHFGNPDLQCISCDCNLEGTERPSCDAETGECICRPGVSGIFCEECAAGYDSTFPACKKCHECNALWAENVTDVHRAAQRMRTLIPSQSKLQPLNNLHLQKILDLYSMMQNLSSLKFVSPPMMEKAEKLYTRIRKLADAVDTNKIVVNQSPLLNTEIDNIYLELKKLQNKMPNFISRPSGEGKSLIKEFLSEIQKLYKDFMSDEKRVRNANKVVENSMDTRQEVKQKLSACGERTDLTLLEKKVKELSLAHLIQKVCGEASLENCSNCEGFFCSGALPVSIDASTRARLTKDRLDIHSFSLNQTEKQITNASQLAQDTKNQAKKMQDRISNITATFEKEKQETKELIQQVKKYLTVEIAPPDDVEKMANAVLSIKLPRSADEIQSMIKEIKNLLSNVTKYQADLKKLEENADTAQKLLEKAQELKNRTKNIDVKEIQADLLAADEAQNKANNDLDLASRDKDDAEIKILDVEDKLDEIEAKLMNRSNDLLSEIEGVKNKTEQNKEMLQEAQDAAMSAMDNATEAKKDFMILENLFLRLNFTNQPNETEAEEHLKKIIEEAEEMKRHVEDSLKQIQDLEQRMKELIQKKEDKEEEVSKLLAEVEALQKDITTRAEEYANCAT